MSIRPTLRTLVLAPGLALLPAACGPEAAPMPDVLLVTLDTCRADHLGCYGYAHPTSPAIDALAASGILFERAYSVAPTTLPSHTSILTGLAPPSHGVRDNLLFRLPEEAVTLAECLGEAGYRTGAVPAASVLMARFGLAQGFEHFDEEGLDQVPQRRAEEVTDRALAWLADPDPRPWFLWVHYFDAHHPYHPPPDFAAAHEGRPYDGEIAYLDHHLGRLLEAVSPAGRPTDTLVALTADHGESLGEHGESYHSVFVYDATLRVPLVLAGPGVPAGRRVANPVTNRDLAATLLQQVGLGDAVLPGAGRSLLRSPPREVIYGESFTPAIRFGWAPLQSLRTADALYVKAPREELYASADDPGQLRDLAAADPDAVAAHRRRLEVLLDALPAPADAMREEASTDEELRQLEQLGYLLRDADPRRAAARGGDDPKDRIRVVQLLRQGQTCSEQGDLDGAEQAWQEAADLDPRNITAWMNLGSVHYRRYHHRKAAHAYERALGLRPDYWLCLSELGMVREALGEYEEAARLQEQALRLAPVKDQVERRLQRVQEKLRAAAGADR